MNHRDVWFVGLLALAYLYLDAAAPATRRQGATRAAGGDPRVDDAADAIGVFATEGCPRDGSHSISLRADGAMWCLACDEGFFPAGLVI
jgi:hypothetical protein